MTSTNTFRTLLNEAQFTKEILGSGATRIRNANYAKRGIYFEAFTSLSTGLERIGKLCLLLDYYSNTNGSFPEFKYMKNEIGHKIDLLYERAQEVRLTRMIPFHFDNDLSDSIHQSILSILSDFATGDRYSNINLLLNSKQTGDPIAAWFERVDVPIFEQRVTSRKKQSIASNAQIVAQMIQNFSMVQHTSETGTNIDTVEEGSFRTGMQEAVAPFRQLYVLQIIRFWVELVFELQYVAMAVGRQEIPFFSEVFAPFYNPDSYFRSRKTWNI